MKEIITIPGKTYAVTSSAGCTVTTDDGKTLTAVLPGKQATFVAIAGKVIVDGDDAACVTPSNFSLAPIGADPVGAVDQAAAEARFYATKAEGFAGQLGDAALQGADNTFTGTNTFNGDMAYNGNAKVPANELAFEHFAAMDYLTYGCDWEVSKMRKFFSANKNIAFPASMPTPTALQTKSDIINLFSNVAFETLPPWVFEGVKISGAVFANSKIKRFPDVNMFPNLEQAAMIGGYGLFRNMPELEEFPDSFTFEKMYWASEFAAACPKLRKAHGLNLVNLREGNGFMTNAQLDKETVLAIFSTIRVQDYSPIKYKVPTGFLHLGIHVDLKTDEEVQAAIAMGSAPIEEGGKNWNVIVQWNGTATATTFALRPAPPLPVYAKIETYTREDGTEWSSLSWCHEVFTPDGREPEELGYTMFESVEAAREYFGLPEVEEEPAEASYC